MGRLVVLDLVCDYLMAQSRLEHGLGVLGPRSPPMLGSVLSNTENDNFRDLEGTLRRIADTPFPSLFATRTRTSNGSGDSIVDSISIPFDVPKKDRSSRFDRV